MKTVSIKTVIFGLVLVAFISEALGHSYLTNPTSRSNQKQTTTGCRGPACLGPCDRKLSAATRAPIVAARGSTISVEWPRNNHAGGFIRLAWAPTSQSDSHSAFDNGVQQINCHEVGGCKPDDPKNPNGGDSAPADGSRQPCKVSITIPTHLTDGKWTLQWAWYGGAYQLGDYYSCTDYTISGGTLTSAAAAPVFKGGDYSYPGQQKCKFFNTDRLHRCVNEPCDNPVYSSGERSGPAFMTGIVNTNAPATQAPTSAPTSAPTKAPTSTPSPTKAPTQAPSTPAPTQAPTNAPSGGSSGCTLGYMRCSGSNTFETCTNGRSGTSWVGPQTCGSGLFCNPSGNYIYCDRTASTSSSSSGSSTPSSSTSCTLGQQQCVGSSGYKTCGNGRDGPEWAATQSCQSGLTCDQRGDNIYCI